MGIFMITISQINSHTMDRVYPSNQPATPASSLPLTSSFPWLSYCVTSKLARARPGWTPRAEATRTGKPASTS